MRSATSSRPRSRPTGALAHEQRKRPNCPLRSGKRKEVEKLTTSAPTKGTQDIQQISRKMVGGRRLILASNRGPIEHDLCEGRCEARQGEGGVAVALSSAARYTPLAWVASAMTEGDRQIARHNGNGNGAAPVVDKGVYKHGMRIEVRGRYADIVKYLRALEAMPAMPGGCAWSSPRKRRMTATTT